MSDRTPEPSELIYAPAPSWAPTIVALGLAIMLTGVYLPWFFALVGAFIVLLGIRSWVRTSDDEISRMRRQQALDTAVLPAEPIRRGDDASR